MTPEQYSAEIDRLKRDHIAALLPACMMPNGGVTCAAFAILQDKVESQHAAHIAAHRISVDTIRHLEAEIVRLQAHLKGVRLEIEQAWRRVQVALSE